MKTSPAFISSVCYSLLGIDGSGKHVQTVQEDEQLCSAEVAEHALLRVLGVGHGEMDYME